MKKFALLGEKLGHSYSPLIHEILFAKMNVDASYELIECNKDELNDYILKLKKKEFTGFNITIPYKVEIMKYLDKVSPEAEKIGSVNTIAVQNGKVIGYNTDYDGFLDTLLENKISVIDKNCYILGTGGASLAVRQVILDQGGYPIFVSRTKEDKENTIDYEDLENIKIIELLINTTPVGMYPHMDVMPIKETIAERVETCIDIIFNPLETKLLKQVKKGYNGLLMLVGQAIRAEEIWHQKDCTSDIQNILEMVVNKLNE